MPTRPDRKKTKEFGYTTKDQHGIIVNDDYNNKLRGTTRVTHYDKMRLGDPTVKGLAQAIKLPIKSASWRITPASEEDIDLEIADFIEDQLLTNGRKTWQQLLTDILLFLDYGSMAFEKVYEFLPDGRVGLKKISPRYPETITSWKLKSGEDGIVQQAGAQGAEIPMDKLMVFVNEKEGDNWEGISVYRSAYRSWVMKDKLILIDAIATERQGLGIPSAEVPSGTSDPEKDKIATVLRNLRANEQGYVISEVGKPISFLDMKANTIKQVKDMVDYHDRQILLGVLAQFLHLGANSTGSYALSEDHSDLFILSIESVAKTIADTFNRFLIPELVGYNYDTDQLPELVYDEIGQVDIQAFSTAIQRIAQANALDIDESVHRHVRDVLGLPESEGETITFATADEFIDDLREDMTSIKNNIGSIEDKELAKEILKRAQQLINNVQRDFLKIEASGEKLTHNEIAEIFEKYFDEKASIKEQIAELLVVAEPEEPEEPEEDSEPTEGTFMKLYERLGKVREYVKSTVSG